jgi:uncharacterized protein (TIGR03083 family)
VAASDRPASGRRSARAAAGQEAPANGSRTSAGTTRIVAALAEEWGAIARLLAELPDESWSLEALPGWDVHAVVAHLIGTERMLAGDEVPPPLDSDQTPPHVRNDIARSNEAWVEALRSRTPAELSADFEDVTARRLSALRVMTDDELHAPSWTPAGDATYGRFMQIRVFDCWMHEQDVRSAVGQPGHEDGPVPELCLDEVSAALGYIVAKRGGAPDGARVTIELTGPVRRSWHVAVNGRARVVDHFDEPPTASLALSSSLFLRLVGGRVAPETALERIRLGGDLQLAQRLATHLAYTI